VITLLSWNMAGRDLWDDVAQSGVDVALLQEAKPPRGGAAEKTLPPLDDQWGTAGWPKRNFRTAVAALSERVTLSPRPNVAIDQATEQQHWSVGRVGTITAADVAVDGRDLFTAVSVYSPWERTPNGGLYADAAAHRILSDLSALMFTRRHRLVIAGDWNILRGYGEHGDDYYADRYRTVFDRASALGLRLVGPQAPNGRQADPWPEELPSGSRNVPTYHHNRQTPQTATRQLDFVFASETIADQITTSALNEPEQWGGSDHCQVRIDVHL
jgi:exonuclease III